MPLAYQLGPFLLIQGISSPARHPFLGAPQTFYTYINRVAEV
jgi:hypothetical protein